MTSADNFGVSEASKVFPMESPSSPAMSWAAGYMSALEKELAEIVKTPDPLITEIASHLISAGGKRIRPLIAFSIARALGYGPEARFVSGAAAVELVHLASLYHDDVMDEAAVRRGVESVNSRWGNLTAVVTGDFLLARAAGIAARLGAPIAELLADTLAQMCEGQILEVGSAYSLDRTVEGYYQALSGKTASLMATSAKIPAMLACADEEFVESVTELGHHLGMIFQLRDDVMDLFATSADLHKAIGQDLEEGVYTLPILSVVADQDGRRLIEEALESLAGDQLRERVCAIVMTRGGVEQGKVALKMHLDRVEAISARFPDRDLGGLVGFASELVENAIACMSPSGYEGHATSQFAG